MPVSARRLLVRLAGLLALLATAAGAGLYMRRAYHHFTDAPAMLRSLAAALRPGGRLAVIDLQRPRWIPGGPNLGAVQAWSPIDYCLLFRKPLVPGVKTGEN